VRGIHHVDLVVSDLERSPAFHRDLLGPVGYVREGRKLGVTDRAAMVARRIVSGRSPDRRPGVGRHGSLSVAGDAAVGCVARETPRLRL
jgi:catechol 2,3-dioxygenase-like lactoylglutathione lyase family enzyme